MRQAFAGLRLAIVDQLSKIEHDQTVNDRKQRAADAVQIHGAAGIIRGNKVERIFRESKILSIGGGSTEVMKDLAARQSGI